MTEVNVMTDELAGLRRVRAMRADIEETVRMVLDSFNFHDAEILARKDLNPFGGMDPQVLIETPSGEWLVRRSPYGGYSLSFGPGDMCLYTSTNSNLGFALVEGVHSALSQLVNYTKELLPDFKMKCDQLVKLSGVDRSVDD